MSDVVNLNQYRKERAKDLRRKRVAENRLRFGSKTLERKEARRGEERRDKEHDGKRLKSRGPADESPDAG